MRPRALAAIPVTAAFVLLLSACIGNGTWVATTLATPAASSATTVTDVSCVDQFFCVAVGSTGFVETWDGAAWSVGTRPPAAAHWGRISDIDCGSPDRCLAVVDDETGPVAHPHLLGWNGSAWSDVLGHRLDLSAEPTAFSCPQADSCLIVDPWAQATIVWGTTGLSTTPFSTVDPPGHLLSCLSTADCLAIASNGWTTSWNGALWAPIIEADEWQPTAVDCPGSSVDSCVAVGHDAAGSTSVAATWDGQGWTFTPLPVSATTWTGLGCGQGRECVALGNDAEVPVGLAGDTWYGVTAPPGGSDAEYRSISCGLRWCMAVGRDVAPSHALLAAQYRWTMP